MNPWQKLEIEPTSDVSAIRRAYARKLKTIDVDADPQAFIGLRDALTLALTEAKSPGAPNIGADDIELAPAPIGSSALMETAPAAPSARVFNKVGSAGVDDRVAALATMLFTDEAVAAIDPARLATAVNEVLQHPDMVRIDHSMRVEHQLAELLYRSLPRSDSIISMVVDRFGWRDRAGEWDLPWLFGELARYRDASDLFAEVRDPRHQLHRAYLDLVSSRRRLGISRSIHVHRVAQLLAAVRQIGPAAEAQLASHRVALWDERLSRKFVRGFSIERILTLGFVALLLLSAGVRLVTSMNTSPVTVPQVSTQSLPVTAAAPSPPLATTSTLGVRHFPTADIYLEPILRNATADLLGIDDLASRNPLLYGRLVARWQQARNRNEQNAALETDVRALLTDALRAGLRSGTFAVQSAYWRFMAEELTWLLEKDAVSCAALIDGKPMALVLPRSLVEARDKVRVLAISEVIPSTVPLPASGEQARLSIPDLLFEAAAQRARMSPTDLNAALNAPTAPPDQRCRGRIALIEAALALPEHEAAPFLRDISAGL